MENEHEFTVFITGIRSHPEFQIVHIPCQKGRKFVNASLPEITGWAKSHQCTKKGNTKS